MSMTKDSAVFLYVFVIAWMSDDGKTYFVVSSRHVEESSNAKFKKLTPWAP
jgi:hypothetical protein